MQSDHRLQLVRQEAYPISFWRQEELVAVDQVEVYEFVPQRRVGVARRRRHVPGSAFRDNRRTVPGWGAG